MATIVKPPRLRRGDVIGVCAPASSASAREDLESGVRYLEKMGFRVRLGRNVHRRRGYLAGSDAERASDINDFFSDRTVKAIFTVRGGYGSGRILSLLDYPLMRRHPKIFVGYSDITALHFAMLARAGLITFSGPMVAVEMSQGLEGQVEARFWENLMHPRPPLAMTSASRGTTAAGKKPVKGRLLGGNLTLIATLLGTPYFPRIRDPLILIEEIDERPYRVNRMLQQLKLAGVLDRAAGIALGRFIDCRPEKGKPSLTIQQVIEDTFSGYRYPVLAGIPYGHFKESLSFPIGIRVKLDTGAGQIIFLEPAVE